MENLTKTIGLDIRDKLRADSTLLTLLGITALTAKNYIFLTTPVEQIEGFTNPRIVIVPVPSIADEVAPEVEIYKGTENLQVQCWINDRPYDTPINILDRIVTIFNNTQYTFSSGGTPYNFGVYKCSGKISFKDPDKENTVKCEINISLEIGGF